MADKLYDRLSKLRDYATVVWPLAQVAAIGEADVAGLVADLALKAPLASPTFTGGVTADNLTLSSGAANGIIINCTLSSGSSFLVWRRTTNKFVWNLTGTNNNLVLTNSVTTRLQMQYNAAGGTVIGNSTDAIGFFGGAGAAKPSGSVLTGLTNLGLFTSPTIAESDVTNLTADLALKAPLDSPALTGTPTAPTAAASDSSTTIATTAFVGTAVGAIPISPNAALQLALAYGIAF